MSRASVGDPDVHSSSAYKIPAGLPGTGENDLSLLPQFLYPTFDGSLRKIQSGSDFFDIPAGDFPDEIGKAVYPRLYTAICTATYTATYSLIGVTAEKLHDKSTGCLPEFRLGVAVQGAPLHHQLSAA